jgi:hypothetical protein
LIDLAFPVGPLLQLQFSAGIGLCLSYHPAFAAVLFFIAFPAILLLLLLLPFFRLNKGNKRLLFLLGIYRQKIQFFKREDHYITYQP